MACFAPILKMNTTKTPEKFSKSARNIKGHTRSCSLNQDEPGDVIKTTRYSFFDNEKFWT